MAYNERIDDIADIQRAKEQFDYLHNRINEFVDDMEKASKVAKLTFGELKTATNYNELTRSQEAAAGAADAVKVALSGVKSTAEKLIPLKEQLNGHTTEFVRNLKLLSAAETEQARTSMVAAKADTEKAKAATEAAKADTEKAKQSKIAADASISDARAAEIAAKADTERARAATEAAKADTEKARQSKIAADAAISEARASEVVAKAEKERARANTETAKADTEKVRQSKLSADASLSEAKATEAAARAKESEARYVALLTKEKERLERARDKELKKLQQEESAYSKLNKEYTEAANKARDLGAEYFRLEQQLEELNKQIVDAGNAGLDTGQLKGALYVKNVELENMSVRLKAANEGALKLNKGLQSIDANIGRYQRNVGNYNGAVMAMSQILREAPSFAYSTATGLLAVSNNIPILVDEIDRLKKVNEGVVAAGGKAVPIWKTLSQALFSFNGMVTIGVTALTLFAARFNSASAATDTAAKSLEEYNKNLKNAVDGAYSSLAKERAELDSLLRTAKDVNTIMKDRLAAVEELQRKYPDYLGHLKQEQILTGDIAKELDILNSALMNKAMISAGEQQMAAAYKRLFEAQNSINKLREEFEKNNKKNIQDNIELMKGMAPEEQAKRWELFYKPLNASIQVFNKEIQDAKKEIENIGKWMGPFLDSYKKNIAAAKGIRTRAEIENDIKAAKAVRDTTASTTDEHQKALKTLKELNIELNIYLDKSKRERNGATIVEGINEQFQAEKRNEQAIAELQKQRWSQQKAEARRVFDDESKNLEERLEAYTEYQQAAIMEATISSAKEIAINESKLKSIAEKEELLATGKIKLSKYQQKVLELDKDTYSRKLIAAQEQQQTQLTEIEAQGIIDVQRIRRSDYEARRRKMREFIAEEQLQLEERIADWEQAYTNEADVLAQAYMNREISERQFREKMRLLRLNYSRIELEAEIKENEFLLNQDELTAEQRLNIQRRLNDARQRLSGINTEQAGMTRQYAFDLTDADFEQADRILKLTEQAFSVERAISDLTNQRLEKEINEIERKKKAIQDAANTEIEAINKSMLSEAEKERQIAIIKGNAAAQEQEYIRQQNDLRRKQAINERIAAAGQIVQQTSIAVMAALKIPPPLGPIVAGGIATTGALQLGKALSTEIPQYGDGVKDKKTDGLGIVGERREPELVEIPGQAPQVVSEPTLMYLPKHTDITPRRKLANKMGALVGALSPQLLEDLRLQEAQIQLKLNADVNKLIDETKETRRAIINKKEVHFSWKNGELQHAIKNGNSVTKVISKYFN